ncbi:monovalent cation/H(+) antiporter subunit G [Vibrio variabilis]|uniref:monovalent cation/H(+) antiporter subunit G n=1 Tax=Vibrio variabilis TaxID=990271 RepID=UPI000DD8A439|nr:monovalent cation/H(+) antiporter subunit G [Vibrio variabilis]
MSVMVAVLLVFGTLLILIASIGVVRMPDLYTRMHAATKAGTVGLAALLFAVALTIHDLTVLSRVVGTLVFILLTAPVAAHLLGKSMQARGYQIWRNPRAGEVKVEDNDKTTLDNEADAKSSVR